MSAAKIATVDPPAPPHDLEAEESVLSAILRDSAKAFPLIIAAGLTAEMFYSAPYGSALLAAYELHREGIAVDNVSLAARLEREGNLDRLGGRARLAGLQDKFALVGNAGHYSALVREMYEQRGQLREAQAKVVALSNGHRPVDLDSDVLAYVARREFPEAPGAALWSNSLLAEFLELVRPCCEAADIALVVQFVAALGCVIGPDGPFFEVGAERHTARVYPMLVGETSLARKGGSIAVVVELFKRADGTWQGKLSGLTTGEGVIGYFRDAPPRDPKDKSQPVAVLTDKRGFIVETEGGRVLTRANAEGSILPYIIIQSFDGPDMRVMTRHDPLVASNTHIVIDTHTTPTDLRDKLSEVSQTNGFANRFLFMLVKSERVLPSPESFGMRPGLAALTAKLHDLLVFARSVGAMKRDDQAEELWRSIYEQLNFPAPRTSSEIVASLCARGPVYVMRLSMLFALMDGAREIAAMHLLQALELWSYAERSIDALFGDTCGRKDADTILIHLRRQFEMDRTELYEAVGKNWSADRIAKGLAYLLERHLANYRRERSGDRGRPREVWSPSPNAHGIAQDYLRTARKFVTELEAVPEPMKSEPKEASPWPELS